MKFDPCNCTPKAMVALATTIAFALSEGLSSNEVNALGTFFSIIGDDLQYIGAHLELCQSNQSGNKQEKEQKTSHDKKADSHSPTADKGSSYRARFMDCLNDIPEA